MTDNMENLQNLIKVSVDNEYTEKLPTEDQIYIIADKMREALQGLYPVTDEEYAFFKKTTAINYCT